MLRFTQASTSAFLIAVYAAVFTVVLVSNSTPKIPGDTLGLDLSEAYYDLHQIATRPHPFNSHANDVAREYILARLNNITYSFDHITVEDDLTSAATWVSKSHAVSFEGSNVLVKVEGTDPEFSKSGGVLFSAHFDSVPTAPGVTDDGIGVATLLAFVKYLTTHRTRRTAIFNINNGEEDGVNGAHVFLQHPWSRIPDTFLNLEGAAAGGRPLLFRATSTAPVLSFKNKDVFHPHGNVLSADAFSRGVINSGTDFTVYNHAREDGPGMEGVDFAFYQGRSKYHTKYDSIPGARGAKRSLWTMMETVRGAGMALLNEDRTHVGSDEPLAPVYFDLFGLVFVVLTQRSLFLFNVFLLIAGPIIIAFLRITYSERSPAKIADKWGKFWASFVVGLALQFTLALSFIKINPFIVYSHPYLVLGSTLSLAYLTTTFIMNAKSDVSFADGQKSHMLLQMYIFTWVLLVAATIGLKLLNLGGIYVFSAWNAFACLGCAVGIIENISPAARISFTDKDARSRSPTSNPSEITETSPLVEKSTGPVLPSQIIDERPSFAWGIIQLLLVVPIPITLLSHILLLLVDSLSQTLSDGNNPVIVYGAMGIMSFLIVIPMSPFTLKIHPWITSLLALVFVVMTMHNLVAFPFSQDVPLKVYFKQKVLVDIANPDHGPIQTLTTLVGATQYLEDYIVSELPSSWKSSVLCQGYHSSPRLSICSWESSLSPSPIKSDSTERRTDTWLEATTSRLTPTSALISVKGTNTRVCRLYFDNRRIRSYRVYDVGAHGALVPSTASTSQSAFPIPKEGLDWMWLWSREWDKTFVVEVAWDADEVHANVTNGLSGRVGCEWAEYESATLGLVTMPLTGAIPAYEEVLDYLPSWAVSSKVSGGLVEVFGHFTV
ncbi:hypothetical protein M413DRAFT_448810 [Hebeloma cylindrosporum]|uniref:Peptide hydrolase n=1 Tax=Hebeloma cylindrosporum TaxID=76867 RepID=A0A0C3BJG1_HEBCY|nr:hypothetical protein M413DRAFT_448810 [Hebeloma cylindrosporum h7]